MSNNMSTTNNDWLSLSSGVDTITINVDDYLTTTSDVYTITSGTNGLNWGSIGTSPNMSVSGDVTIDGELSVQGVKLSERLDKIEEKLAILRPNEELEERWENLRGLRKAYMELEAEIIEKEKMWAILQK